MRHPSLSAGEIDWPATRLVIFGQDDAFRFMARSTFRKLAAGEVFSTSVATDMPTFLAQAPHLALLDLGGEPRAALAVLAALRSAAPVLPVLVVHKGGEAERVAEARALGIEGILPKPVSGHELMVRAVGILKAPQRLPADVRSLRLSNHSLHDETRAAPAWELCKPDSMVYLGQFTDR